MASFNKAQLIGNLGRDPEVRYTPNGTAVCSISVATTNSWNDKRSGDRVEQTEWHRVIFYGRLAEVVGEHMKKGRSMFVEGRLRTRQWTDRDGVTRYATEIVASEMQMLGTKPDDGKPPTEPADRGDVPAQDDDIPF
jgi:single-strand DNA-binding protein